MKRQGNKLDALLKQKLGGLEAETNPQDWLAIRARLDRENTKPPGFFKRNSKYLALLLLCTLIGVGIGYFLRPQDAASKKYNHTNSGNINVGKSKKELAENAQQNADGPGTDNTGLSESLPGNKTGDAHRENAYNPAVTGREETASSTSTAKAGNIHAAPGQDETISSARYGLKPKGKRPHFALTHAVKPSTPNMIVAGRGTGKQSSEKRDSVNPKKATGNAVENTPAVPGDKTNIIAGQALPSVGMPDNTLTTGKNNPRDSVTEKDSTQIKRPTAAVLLTPDSLKPAGTIAKAAIKTAKNNRLSLVISYSPQVSSHTLVANAALADYKHKDYDSIRARQERGGYSYNASFGIEYRIKSFIFQTGIGYKRYTETLSYNFTNNNIPVLDSATGRILGYITIPGGVPTQYSHVNTYNYITIPLMAGYSFRLSQKFGLLAKAGGELMYLSSNTGQAIRPDDLSLQSVSEMKILRAANYTLFANIAVEYRLSKILSISLGPDFRQLQRSIYTDKAPAAWRPWSAGINFSTRISLL
jgi:hypothetical protein